MLSEFSAAASGLAASAFSALESSIGRTGASIVFLGLAISLYTAIVGSFYNFISKRELYKLRTSKRGGWLGEISRMGGVALMVLNYTLVFPLITFAWFALISASIYIISDTASLEAVFLITISILISVRLLAYYRESISVDLAKILPLALLGVFIVDHAEYSVELVRQKIALLVAAAPAFLPYLAYAVVLEWSLKIFSTLIGIALGFLSPAPKSKKQVKLKKR